MKDNFDNKPLEEFFLNHLDRLEDDPKDGFWEELEPLIPPPPKKRRRLLFWWWGFGLLLALAVGGYLWHKGQRINHLSEKMAQQQLQIEALIENKEKATGKEKQGKEEKQEIETTPEKTEASVLSQLDRKEAPNTSRTKNKVSRKPIGKVEEKNTPVLTAKSINTTEDLVSPLVVVAEPVLPVDTMAEPVSGKVVEAESFAGERSPLLQFDELERLLNPVELMPVDHWVRTFDSLDLVRDFESLFDVGIYYEHSALKWLKTSASQSLLRVDSSSFQGRDLGLEIGLRLGKKWRLSTGVGWTKMLVNSETFGEITFSTIDTTFEAGFLYNNYDYSASSALGTTDYSAEIGVQYRYNIDRDPKDGDPILFGFLERAELDYLHLPLHLRYQFGENKWTWNAGVGIDYYYLLKADVYSQEAEQIVADGMVKLRNISVSNESRLVGLKNSLWGARASLGLSFKPAKKWQLSLSGAYQFGLSAITDSRDSEGIGLRTNLDLLQFRFGVHYEF